MTRLFAMVGAEQLLMIATSEKPGISRIRRSDFRISRMDSEMYWVYEWGNPRFSSEVVAQD